MNEKRIFSRGTIFEEDSTRLKSAQKNTKNARKSPNPNCFFMSFNVFMIMFPFYTTGTSYNTIYFHPLQLNKTRFNFNNGKKNPLSFDYTHI